MLEVLTNEKSLRDKHYDARFQMNVDLLKAFKKEFGHTDVTNKSNTTLSEWCRGLRRGANKSTDVRNQLLREAGFDFGGTIKKRKSDAVIDVAHESTQKRGIVTKYTNGDEC